MGSLKLPSNGFIYIDAQIAIYTVDKHPTYGPVCRPLWEAVASGQVTAVSSDLVLLETLVWPLRTGDSALASDREALWRQPNTKLLPITREVLREAARLRATLPRLKTPDAIHAATAVLNSCPLFVTNDADLRKIPGLTVAYLEDVIAAT